MLVWCEAWVAFAGGGGFPRIGEGEGVERYVFCYTSHGE